MKFTATVELTVNASSSDEAEKLVSELLDSADCIINFDISDGPTEVAQDPSEEEEDEKE